MLRRTSPLPQQGKRAAESRRVHARVFPALLEREDNLCQGCGRGWSAGLIHHHVCGRPGSGMCLGAIADSVELGALLCSDDPATGRPGCHSIVHADPLGPVAEKLLRAAYERLGGRVDGVECDATGWRELIRQIVREREEAG